MWHRGASSAALSGNVTRWHQHNPPSYAAKFRGNGGVREFSTIQFVPLLGPIASSSVESNRELSGVHQGVKFLDVGRTRRAPNPRKEGRNHCPAGRTPRLLSSITSIWAKSLVRRFQGQEENPRCNAGLEAESPRTSSFSADSLLGVTPSTSNGAAGHSQMFSRFGIVLDKHASLPRYCHLLFCPKPGASPPVSL